MSSKRTNEIKIRLTDDELVHVNELAKLSGLSREAYTRMLYKKVIPRPCPSDELLETITQLRRIGNNINQIAFVANSTKIIDKDYFKECFQEVRNEILSIKKIISVPQTFCNLNGKI